MVEHGEGNERENHVSGGRDTGLRVYIWVVICSSLSFIFFKHINFLYCWQFLSILNLYRKERGDLYESGTTGFGLSERNR